MFRTARARALRPALECLESREVPATVVGVTDGNVLDRFDTASPGAVTTIGAIGGLATGESVLGLAFRPSTGGLYAVGFIGDGTEQLYLVDPLTAVATPIGTRFASGGVEFVPTAMTFDPVLDQVRLALIIADVGERDIRLNPDTGAFIKEDPRISSGSVVTIAHTNPFPGASTTTLYGYDSSANEVVTVDPASGDTTTLGPSGVPPAEIGIYAMTIGGDNAAYLTAGDLAGLGTFAPNSANETLYSVNLATGAATPIGALDPTATLNAIAIAPAASFSVSGYPSPATPGTTASVTVTALDVYGVPVPGYRGTTALTSSDPAASLEAPHALPGGSGTFAVTLNTLGTQSITATDTQRPSITGSQTGIVVQSAAQTMTRTVGGPLSVSEAFGPMGTVLVLVEEDGTLMQFDATGTRVLGGGVRSANVTFGPTGEVLLVVTNSGALMQFDVFGARTVFGSGVRSANVTFGPAGEVLLVVGENGMLGQFDSTGMHLLGAGVRSASIAYGPAGQVIVVALQSGDVLQFDSSGMRKLGDAVVRFIGVTYLGGSQVLLVLFDDSTAIQFDRFGARVVL